MNPATAATPTAVMADTGLHSPAERLLLPGLGLGIAGDYLLRDGLAGPGLCVWLALLAGAALWLTRDAGDARRRALARWSAVALCAGLFTVVRDLELLIPFMLLAVLACAVVTALETSGMTLRAARVRDYFATGFTFPLQLLAWTPRLLKQADLSAVTHDQRLPGLVRGLLLATPVLLVFGVLFASADAGFTRYASRVTELVSPRIFQHLLLVGIFTWLGMSLLGVACRKAQPASATANANTPKFNLGAMEAHVVLALVSALFAAFVLLQLGYLFGGSAVILDTSGLTVAEYARRGFFELIVVAALTLGLLLVLDATDCERHILRRYGIVLVLCVLVILASALQRLFLYTGAFGMTLERFSALSVLSWQAFNLVSFAATVLRGQARGFASALVISGIASLLLLALANPAALVAKINLERAVEDGKPLDVRYLTFLGADAVPPTLASLAELPASQQCDVARNLLSEYRVAPDGSVGDDGRDWRRWTLGRAAATNAVAGRADELYRLADLPRVTGPLPAGPRIRRC